MADQPFVGWSARTDAEFDALFVREFGSFLRNVRPGAAGVCGVCMTPVSSGYALCRPCSQIAPPAARHSTPSMLSDRRAFLTYAVEGEQAYSVLRGYKTPWVADRYWMAAATWVVWFLTRHGYCAHRLAGSPPSGWLWATVPSARSGRTGEHPLHRIVTQVWGAQHGEARLALAAGAEGQARGYHPAKFTAAPLSPGSHVILIDDSWTTGANVQSAATALKAAGAGQVSAMVLGRLLNDSWEPTRRFIERGGLGPAFDLSICPWTGRHEPTPAARRR